MKDKKHYSEGSSGGVFLLNSPSGFLSCRKAFSQGSILEHARNH